MRKIIIYLGSLIEILFFILICSFSSGAQTNPVSQSLPYTQNFSSFTGSTTSYPAGIQGWGISGSLSTTFKTVAAASDQALAGATNASGSAFVGDMNGKIGLLSTGSNEKAICIAINTTSLTGINVSYLAQTQAQTSAGRINEIGVQYRVGTSGSFTTLASSTYQNNATSTINSGTSGSNSSTISFSLPITCEGNAVVQLRWVIRDVSGSGSRPSFSIDDISITSSSPCSSAPTTQASSLNSGSGSTSLTLNWTTGTGASRIVVARQSAAVSFTPSDNTTYTANSNFTTATDLGSGNKVVYNGTGNSTTVTGLLASTNYQFAVYEYNCGAGNEKYLISSPPTVSQTTTVASVGGTVLSPGDLIFVGFDPYIGGAPDSYAILALVDLAAGTSFSVANATYELNCAPNVRSKRWYDCSGNPTLTADITSVKVTLNNAVSKGSVLCFIAPNNGLNGLTVNGSAWTSGTDYTTVTDGDNNGININTSKPDAIFLLQGQWSLGSTTGNSFSTFNGKVLGGIQNGATWYSVSTDTRSLTGNANRISRVPPDIECFFIQGSTTTATADKAYYYNGVTSSTSYRNWIKRIVNFGSWTIVAANTANDLTSTICGSSFGVTGSGTPGDWIGDLDKNWFNCQNWDNLAVPDSSVDVLIGASATQSCEILASAAFSDNYQDTARCKDLRTTHKKIAIEAPNTSVLKVYGDLFIDDSFSPANSGQLDMSDGSSGTPDGKLYLYGNWNNTKETEFKQGESTIIFCGSSNQTISSTDPSNREVISTLEINKPSGYVSLACSTEVESNLMLTKGNIKSTTLNNIKFTLDATTITSTANAGGLTNMGNEFSFIDGPMKWSRTNNSKFTFPIGKNGVYGPVSIDPVSPTSATFSAEYFNTGYGDYTLKPVFELDHVSKVEYWDVDGPVGNDVEISLYWRSPSIVSTLASGRQDLRVAHFVNTDAIPGRDAWNREGNISPAAGTTAWGEVISDTVSTFSPFTLGTISDINPLPIGEDDLHPFIRNGFDLNQNHNAKKLTGRMIHHTSEIPTIPGYLLKGIYTIDGKFIGEHTPEIRGCYLMVLKNIETEESQVVKLLVL